MQLISLNHQVAIDHHTGNCVTYSFRTRLLRRNYLWCKGSLAFEQAHKAFSIQECIVIFAKWNRSTSTNRLSPSQACLHVLMTCICTCLLKLWSKTTRSNDDNLQQNYQRHKYAIKTPAHRNEVIWFYQQG